MTKRIGTKYILEEIDPYVASPLTFTKYQVPSPLYLISLINNYKINSIIKFL